MLRVLSSLEAMVCQTGHKAVDLFVRAGFGRSPLTAAQLKSGFHKVGLTLTMGEVRVLVRFWDLKGHGRVDPQDLLKGIRQLRQAWRMTLLRQQEDRRLLAQHQAAVADRTRDADAEDWLCGASESGYECEEEEHGWEEAGNDSEPGLAGDEQQLDSDEEEKDETQDGEEEEEEQGTSSPTASRQFQRRRRRRLRRHAEPVQRRQPEPTDGFLDVARRSGALRPLMLLNGHLHKHVLTVNDVFKSAEAAKGSTGALTCREFKQALRMEGIEMSLGDVRVLVKFINTADDGAVHRHELAAAVRLLNREQARQRKHATVRVPAHVPATNAHTPPNQPLRSPAPTQHQPQDQHQQPQQPPQQQQSSLLVPSINQLRAEALEAQRMIDVLNGRQPSPPSQPHHSAPRAAATRQPTITNQQPTPRVQHHHHHQQEQQEQQQQQVLEMDPHPDVALEHRHKLIGDGTKPAESASIPSPSHAPSSEGTHQSKPRLHRPRMSNLEPLSLDKVATTPAGTGSASAWPRDARLSETASPRLNMLATEAKLLAKAGQAVAAAPSVEFDQPPGVAPTLTDQGDATAQVSRANSASHISVHHSADFSTFSGYDAETVRAGTRAAQPQHLPAARSGVSLSSDLASQMSDKDPWEIMSPLDLSLPAMGEDQDQRPSPPADQDQRPLHPASPRGPATAAAAAVEEDSETQYDEEAWDSESEVPSRA